MSKMFAIFILASSAIMLWCCIVFLPMHYSSGAKPELVEIIFCLLTGMYFRRAGFIMCIWAASKLFLK